MRTRASAVLDPHDYNLSSGGLEPELRLQLLLTELTEVCGNIAHIVMFILVVVIHEGFFISFSTCQSKLRTQLYVQTHTKLHRTSVVLVTFFSLFGPDAILLIVIKVH